MSVDHKRIKKGTVLIKMVVPPFTHLVMNDPHLSHMNNTDRFVEVSVKVILNKRKMSEGIKND